MLYSFFTLFSSSLLERCLSEFFDESLIDFIFLLLAICCAQVLSQKRILQAYKKVIFEMRVGKKIYY